MCNACGNVCCGSDEFGGCGCDGCEEPECWLDDGDLAEREDDLGFAASRFTCRPASEREPAHGCQSAASEAA